MNMSPALQLDRIHVAFGSQTVLRDINLDLPAGSVTALIGPSASGKSVLLKCAGGLVPYQRGALTVLGQNAADGWHDLRPRIGVLFQQNALFDSMTVAANIAFPLIRHGMEQPAAMDRAQELLGQVGLPADAGARPPSALSGGMQKRVAFARAIAASPELLLLDDPTAGLDPVMAASIEQLIRHIADTQNATVLLVTADPANLAVRADRVVILDDGQVCWSGDASALPPDAHPLLDAA